MDLHWRHGEADMRECAECIVNAKKVTAHNKSIDTFFERLWRTKSPILDTSLAFDRFGGDGSRRNLCEVLHGLIQELFDNQSARYNDM